MMIKFAPNQVYNIKEDKDVTWDSSEFHDCD